MADAIPPQETQPSLLMKIRDPMNAAAWAIFVDTYASLIYGYLRRRGLQDADAADVGQEVLAQVARSIRSFTYQPERGRFRDWLGAVTRSKLNRFLNRQNRKLDEQGLEAEVALETAVDQAADSDWTADFNSRLLRVALERVRPDFEPTTWKAFEQTWLDGKPAGGVAAELELPIEVVYVAKSRVLKKLREEVLMLAEDVPQLVPLI